MQQIIEKDSKTSSKMYSVKVPETINLIMGSFHRVGFWHREDVPTLIQKLTKFSYFIYHLLFSLSIFTRTWTTDNVDESIFLFQMGLAVAVLSVKLFYIMWRKNEILKIVDQVGLYTSEDCERITFLNDKLQTFNKVTKILIFIIFLNNASASFIVPFVGNEKKLFLNIAFPLDWRNGGTAFWLAHAFLTSELLISCISFLCSVFTWYLMIGCALRCELLGHKIMNMGMQKANNKLTKVEKENLFRRDLNVATVSFRQIRR